MDDSKRQYVTGPLANNSTIKDVLFWISLIVLIGIGGTLIFFFKDGLKREFIVASVGAILTLFAIGLNRQNHTQLAGSLVATTLIAMMTVIATIGEGIYDNAIMAYPAILIITTLILRRNITIYLTGLTIACIGWLVFGDLWGLYQPHFPVQSFARQFYISAIILGITAVAIQFVSETVRKNTLAIGHELEERKKVEKALREAEELYRNMVEETSVITYRDTAEKESQTIYISPQIKDVLGYSNEEWHANPRLWAELTHPDDLPGVLTKIEEYLKTGQKNISEYRMLSKDGRWVWFQDESVVVKDQSGKPQYIHGVLIDITERKQAELKVRQREAILSAVANTAQQLLKTSNWRDEINTILRMLGEATGASHVYVFENHLGADGVLLSSQKYEWAAPGITPELDNPIYQNARLISTTPGLEDWYRNLSAGKPFYGSKLQYPRYWKRVFEERGLRTLLDVPISVNDQWWGIIGFDDFANEMPWSQAEIDALMAAAANLGTAISRQQSDAALHASEEKFQLAFHNTFVPMIISRAEDRVILDANQAFCERTGYRLDETLGHTGSDLNLWVDKEDQRLHYEMLSKQGYAEEFKVGFRRKSGEVGVALISTIPIRLGNDLCLLYTLYDITKIEELLTELKEKNEELQSFTYTVSHDLRAPLITISGFLGYLEQDAKKGNVERVERDALRINEAVAKMQRLLSELLELSRIGRLMNPPEDVPFGEIVQEALRLVAGRLEAKQVEVTTAANFPVVNGDRMRLVEVIQNLVDNAAKFMNGQQKPLIEIGVKIEKDRPVFFVSDNGMGIEPAQQERVFGLFNKLDANTEGTGIGLALVKRIVEVHDGKIWIESDGNGNGTIFYFTLATPSNKKASS